MALGFSRARRLISITALVSIIGALMPAVDASWSVPSVLGAAPAPKPTSVVIAADTTQFSTGQSVVLTGTVNIDVAPSGSVITIVDLTTGQTLKSCSTGTSCSTTTTFYTGTAHTYVAKVAKLTSTSVSVSRAPWTTALASDNSSFAIGESVTFSATSNQNAGATSGNYELYIFDRTTGTKVGSCTRPRPRDRH